MIAPARDCRESFLTLCLTIAARHADDSEAAIRTLFRTEAVAWATSVQGPANIRSDCADAIPYSSDSAYNAGPARMLVAPGLLGDSVRALVAPLMCARRGLVADGRKVRVVQLNGRAGCTRNAARLRTVVLEEAARDGRPIDLVGYSKGCADALHMLGDWPDTHAALRSLTSLGGVVQGTPLARDAPTLATPLLRHLPLPGLGRGDGRAIHDLTPVVRREWLAKHTLPTSIRYLSIVASPSATRVSRVLKSSWNQLAKVDPCNDSQVIASDAVLPASELLAVVDADHWAIALPIARRHPWLAHLLVNRNHFPRGVMLEALMDYVAAPRAT